MFGKLETFISVIRSGNVALIPTVHNELNAALTGADKDVRQRLALEAALASGSREMLELLEQVYAVPVVRFMQNDIKTGAEKLESGPPFLIHAVRSCKPDFLAYLFNVRGWQPNPQYLNRLLNTVSEPSSKTTSYQQFATHAFLYSFTHEDNEVADSLRAASQKSQASNIETSQLFCIFADYANRFKPNIKNETKVYFSAHTQFLINLIKARSLSVKQLLDISSEAKAAADVLFYFITCGDGFTKDQTTQLLTHPLFDVARKPYLKATAKEFGRMDALQGLWPQANKRDIFWSTPMPQTGAETQHANGAQYTNESNQPR